MSAIRNHTRYANTMSLWYSRMSVRAWVRRASRAPPCQREFSRKCASKKQYGLRLDWKIWKLPYQFSRLTCCHATPCCISSVSGILTRCRPHKALRKQAFCQKVKADTSLHAYVGTRREGSARWEWISRYIRLIRTACGASATKRSDGKILLKGKCVIMNPTNSKRRIKSW
jgi:hypothetical protein